EQARLVARAPAAVDVPDDAGAIDQKRRRQRSRAPAAHDLVGRVDRHLRAAGQGIAVEKLPYRVGWLAGVDQHEAQARPQRLADRDQVAERAMAGCAPGREEIDDEDLAAEVGAD